jgi:hypothetical protein
MPGSREDTECKATIQRMQIMMNFTWSFRIGLSINGHSKCINDYVTGGKLGYQCWNQLKDAGKRWIAEIIFSSIKRILGEDFLSKKFCAQKVEVGLNVMLYNKFIGL